MIQYKGQRPTAIICTKISKVISVLAKRTRVQLMTNYFPANWYISLMPSKLNQPKFSQASKNRPNTLERDYLFQRINKRTSQAAGTLYK